MFMLLKPVTYWKKRGDDGVCYEILGGNLETPPLETDSKNPWGSLAEAWGASESEETWHPLESNSIPFVDSNGIKEFILTIQLQ
jgi:hypothetical protein